MSNLVKFPGTKNDRFDNVNLYDWSGRDGEYGTRNEEDLRIVFLNMDIALKYIHDHGYCVKSFNPLDIDLLEGSMEHIKFNYLLEMPIDALDRKKLIQEDIFNSSCVQIGIYTNTLKNLRKEFLKSNFDDFAKHIPQGDVAYYRGVIQRNAAVYLSEYALEKRNRDLESLEKELGEEGIGVSKQYSKNNGKSLLDEPLSNDKINDNIYKQINGLRDAAFVNYLIIPSIVLFLLGAISLVVLLFSSI